MPAMALSVALFIASDGLLKLAGAGLPAAQTIGVCSLLATVFLLLAGARWKINRHVWLRGMLGCVGIYSYLIALFHLPIAIATAVKMLSPLMLSTFAVLWLKEPGHWSAMIAGFVGVVMVTQPHLNVDVVWLGLTLLATVANAARDLLTRFIPAEVSSSSIALVGSAMAGCIGIGWAAIEGLQPIMLWPAITLAASALLLAAAYQLLVVAMRSPNIAAIGWLRYTALLWAVVLGYAVWGEVPSLLAWGGISIIIVSGVLLWRLQWQSSRSTS